MNKGWEYAELPTPLSPWWSSLGYVSGSIFLPPSTGKYEQMYVSLWYIMGTILWTAFVYVTGNVAVLSPPALIKPTSTGCTSTMPWA